MASGNSAMKNQLAGAAAKNWRLNNSYAQQSAQQAYNNVVGGLSDKAIELRSQTLLQIGKTSTINFRIIYNLVNNQKQAKEKQLL